PTPTTPHLLTTNTPPPPTSTLFPYTTLFRSPRAGARPRKRRRANRTVARFPSQEFQLGSGRHAGGAGLRSGREELWPAAKGRRRSEEHTSELQSLAYLVCRLLLEKKKEKIRE